MQVFLLNVNGIVITGHHSNIMKTFQIIHVRKYDILGNTRAIYFSWHILNSPFYEVTLK